MSDDLEEMEAMLRRVEPSGPPAQLRQRVLAAARDAVDPPKRGSLVMPVWAGSMAAMLALCGGLWLMSESALRRAASAAATPVVWTDPAEEAVALLGGDEAARQYVALMLSTRIAAADAPPGPLPMHFEGTLP